MGVVEPLAEPLTRAAHESTAVVNYKPVTSSSNIEPVAALMPAVNTPARLPAAELPLAKVTTVPTFKVNDLPSFLRTPDKVDKAKPDPLVGTPGNYADIDGLYREQANELDPKRREVALRRIQQLMHEKAMFLPIWQFVVLQGVGPRVAEPGLGLITDYPWPAPYEDVKLKDK